MAGIHCLPLNGYSDSIACHAIKILEWVMSNDIDFSILTLQQWPIHKSLWVGTHFPCSVEFFLLSTNCE